MWTSFLFCRLIKHFGCFEAESSFFVEIVHRLSFFACVRLCGNLAIALLSDKLISLTQKIEQTEEARQYFAVLQIFKDFKGLNEALRPFLALCTVFYVACVLYFTVNNFTVTASF